MSEPTVLRDALNGVVTKSTWRPDNTVLIHDGTAWNTLVGEIVRATSGDFVLVPLADAAPERTLPSVEAVRAALSAEGLDSTSNQSYHGWRCTYPERYGPCDCFDEVVERVTAALRAEAKQ